MITESNSFINISSIPDESAIPIPQQLRDADLFSTRLRDKHHKNVNVEGGGGGLPLSIYGNTILKKKCPPPPTPKMEVVA